MIETCWHINNIIIGIFFNETGSIRKTTVVPRPKSTIAFLVHEVRCTKSSTQSNQQSTQKHHNHFIHSAMYSSYCMLYTMRL